MVTESIVGYTSLGWYLQSLKIWSIAVKSIMDFRDSIEKAGVILIGLPLYVT